MNRKEFIKLGIMGVLGSMLPTNQAKMETLRIHTTNNVGMGILNPNQKLRITGIHSNGIGVQ
jgi:hypothetical protein